MDEFANEEAKILPLWKDIETKAQKDGKYSFESRKILIKKLFDLLKNNKMLENSPDYKYWVTAEYLLNYVRSKDEHTVIEKDKMRAIIKTNVKELKSHLTSVIDAVQKEMYEQFGLSLSAADLMYIKIKYTKYCLELFMAQVLTSLKQIIKNKDFGKVADMMKSLNSIKDINKINDPLKLNIYLNMLEQSDLITKSNEEIYLKSLRLDCLRQIFYLSEEVNNEMQFLLNLRSFINNTKIPDFIQKIQLAKVCNGDISFNAFLDTIVNLNEFASDKIFYFIQKLAKILIENKQCVLKDLFQKVMVNYTQNVKILVKSTGDRNFIEVTGIKIVLGHVIKEVEKNLSEDIEEVRFVGAQLMHVDVNLENNLWHGKNIVIDAKTLDINKNVVWNVSGKNSMHNYSTRAKDGEKINEAGHPGSDGYPGESGGNVLILSMFIKNPSNLHIISNGGKGSAGQNGGNGMDGANGTGPTKEEILQNFPSPCKNNPITAKYNRDKCVQYINSIKKETYEYKIDPSFDYFNVKTITNCTIFFCRVKNSFIFLYKGSPGQPGSRGGEFGYGGQGGYIGDITVNDLKVKIEGYAGAIGSDGVGGFNGNPGKDGRDIGYTDYIKWSSEKYHGLDKPVKLSINYGEYGVHCHLKKKYASIIELRSVNLTVPNKTRTNTKKSERQHHSLAIRKKAVSKADIEATYSEETDWIDQQITLQNMRQYSLQEMSKKIINGDNHINLEFKITCSVDDNYHFRYIIKRIIDLSYEKFAKHDTERLVNSAERYSMYYDNWEALKNARLNLALVNRLFSVWDQFDVFMGQANLTGEQVINIRRMLTKKYRFAFLEEIENQLPVYLNIENDKTTISKNAVKYLIKSEQESNITNHVLGNLSQYFQNIFKYRENVIIYVKELLSIGQEIHFVNSMKTFILSIGKMSNPQESLKKYYDKYIEDDKQYQNELNKSLENLESELQKPKNTDLYVLWNKNGNDMRDYDQKKEIKKNSILKQLFKQYYTVLDTKYDWTQYFKQQELLDEYFKLIRESGLSSEFYRELLAYIFNANIKTYSIDKHENYVLVEDLNPSSTDIVHFINTGKTYTELSMDEDYIKLEERDKRSKIYRKVLIDVEELLDKKAYDDYLNDKQYMLESVDGKEDIEYDTENEKIYLTTILETFPADQQELIKIRLHKLKFEYIDKHFILKYISEQFSEETRKVSFEILQYLINSILASYSINDKNTFMIYNWIIAARSQENWIDETFLIVLENYWKKPLPNKVKWREYLSKIENKNIILLFDKKLKENKFNKISIEHIGEILHLLSKIPDEQLKSNLLHTDLSGWTYILKEIYWKHKLSSYIHWSDNILNEASLILTSLDNMLGNSLVNKFINILEGKDRLKEQEYFEIFLKFYKRQWELNEQNLEKLSDRNIQEWIDEMKINSTDEKKSDIEQIIEALKKYISVSHRNLKILYTAKESVNIIKKSEDNLKSKFNVEQITESIITEAVSDFKKEFNQNKIRVLNKENIEKLLSIIYVAIQLKRNVKLNDSQILAALLLLQNESQSLIELFSEEMKKNVILTIAVVKALIGEKVDIITNSITLATHYVEENQEIYSMFDISVSHNCSDNIESRKVVYSNNQVVYGILCNFQQDYLLDRYYGKNILGDRSFCNVIIDEVDTLLLNKDQSVLYLSKNIAGIDKIEPVYIYIWQWISRPAMSETDIANYFDTKTLMNIILNDVFGVITKKDIQSLDTDLSENKINEIWNHLYKNGIIYERGTFIKPQLQKEDLDKLVPKDFVHYKERIMFLINQCMEREKTMRIPNFFKLFIVYHLENWIENAKKAFFMKEKEDYIVDFYRTGTGFEITPTITILNKDTGTDKPNSQWDEALYQFLQLKHGCKMSLYSLKTVYISNVEFFKLYKKLYGLSAIVSTVNEKQLLDDIYKLDFTTIPTPIPKQIDEKYPVFCNTIKDWKNTIFTETINMVEKQNRSVLIICKTINDVEILTEHFKINKVKNVHTYTRDHEFLAILKNNRKLEKDHVIIATNIAGYGLDIKITEELEKAGGIHTILTFFPKKERLVSRSFETAAKARIIGSWQMIAYVPNKDKNTPISIFQMKKLREIDEIVYLQEVKHYYYKKTVVEEQHLKQFKAWYERIKAHLVKNKSNQKIQNIVLNCLLEKWAILFDWMQVQNFDFKEVKIKMNMYINDIEKSTEKNNCMHCFSSPFNKLKYARYLLTELRYKESAKMYSEIMSEEPIFSEAAYYYYIYAMIKINDRSIEQQNHLKYHIRKTIELFNNHIINLLFYGNVVEALKQRNNTDIIQITCYKTQKENLANIFMILIESLNNLLGHSVTKHYFIDLDTNEDTAQTIYTELLEKKVLVKPTKTNIISLDVQKNIANDHGIPLKNLNDFFSYIKDKEIDEIKFEEEIKKFIKFPDRETFWKELIDEKVLHDNISIIVVDGKKLNAIDQESMDLINKNIDSYRLKSETLVLEKNQLLFYPEMIVQNENKHLVFEEYALKNLFAIEKFDYLKNKEIFLSNKKAWIDTGKLNDLQLKNYCSVSITDFTIFNIPKEDATNIIDSLLQENILINTNNNYDLIIECKDIKNIKLSQFPMYENITKAILNNSFAYKRALQKIAEQISDGKTPYIYLSVNPYRHLHFELMRKKVVDGIKITTDSIDLTKTLSSLNVKLDKNQMAHIESKLKKLTGTLSKETNSPLYKLSPLTKYHKDNVNIEELNYFSFNDLQEVIELEQYENIIGESASILQNMIEMTMGILILQYTHKTIFGSSIIGENLHNIIFSFNLWKTRDFSWIEYSNYQLLNTITNSVELITNYFSNNPQKIFGKRIDTEILELDRSTITENETKVSNLSFQVLNKSIIKRINKEAIDELVAILPYIEMQNIIENYIKSFCNKIDIDISLKIDETIERHAAVRALDDIYKVLKNDAESRIQKLTAEFFPSLNQFSLLCFEISQDIIIEIKNILKSTYKERYGQTTKFIKDALKWTSREAHLISISHLFDSYFFNLDKKIQSESNISLSQINSNELDAEINNFKAKITNYWKTFIKEKVQPIIEERIHFTICQYSARTMFKCCGKQIENRFYKKDYSVFDEMKQEYNRKMIEQKEESEASKQIYYYNDTYNENIITLLYRIKQPVLLLNIINENIPLNMSCLALCAELLSEIFKILKVNKWEISITVYGKHISTTTVSTKENEKTTFIEFEIEDQHFQLYHNEDSEQKGKYKTLYEALPEKIKKNMREIDFFNKLIFFIEKNPKIIVHILDKTSL